MSIPDSIKGVNAKLNIKSLLCNKTWIVFHEEEKVIFIFQKDGSLIISHNGVASKTKWEFIKANKTILIEDKNTMLLLHPTFVDDVLFVLQQDGTDGYFVLIDETKIDKFVLNTLATINNYLQDVSGEAQKRLAREERERREHAQKLREIVKEKAKDEIKQATTEQRKKAQRYAAISIGGILLLIVAFPLIAAFAAQLLVYLLFAMLLHVGVVIFCSIRIDLLDDEISRLSEEIIEKYIKQENEYV